MREFKHGIQTYWIEEERGRTLIYFDDGDIKLTLPALDLSDSMIKIILDVYDIAWGKGQDMGEWKAKRAIRDVLGL